VVSSSLHGEQIFLYEVASLKDAPKLACRAAVLFSLLTVVTVRFRR
jgi:hypothetical protein